jgi:large subunit ribosomal protein L13e
LQEAGIPRKLAPTIGISVDARRQTTNQETLTTNVARLKAYKARLILFPRKSGQHKKLDSSAEDVKMAEDESKIVKKVTAAIPIDSGVGIKHAFQEIKKGDMPKGEESAFRKLRIARSDARHAGAREKREKAKAEAEDAKKK